MKLISFRYMYSDSRSDLSVAFCMQINPNIFSLDVMSHFITIIIFLFYLFVEPVALDHRGIEVPLDGVGPLAKVVDFLGRPRRLVRQRKMTINVNSL